MFCCKKLFCNDCIINVFIESDFVCLLCQIENVLIDDLQFDEEVVKKIQEYVKEKEVVKFFLLVLFKVEKFEEVDKEKFEEIVGEEVEEKKDIVFIFLKDEFLKGFFVVEKLVLLSREDLVRLLIGVMLEIKEMLSIDKVDEMKDLKDDSVKFEEVKFKKCFVNDFFENFKIFKGFWVMQ